MNRNTRSGKFEHATVGRVELLDAAIHLAQDINYCEITREQLATAAGCATGTVSNTFGSMSDFKAALMREAIARQSPGIIAQGLCHKCPIARSAPAALKSYAATLIASM